MLRPAHGSCRVALWPAHERVLQHARIPWRLALDVLHQAGRLLAHAAQHTAVSGSGASWYTGWRASVGQCSGGGGRQLLAGLSCGCCGCCSCAGSSVGQLRLQGCHHLAVIIILLDGI